MDIKNLYGGIKLLSDTRDMISCLIVDMSRSRAAPDEMADAIAYSLAVMDAHQSLASLLDLASSKDIDGLKEKYLRKEE